MPATSTGCCSGRSTNRARTLTKLVHPASVYPTTMERYAEEARSR